MLFQRLHSLSFVDQNRIQHKQHVNKQTDTHVRVFLCLCADFKTDSKSEEETDRQRDKHINCCTNQSSSYFSLAHSRQAPQQRQRDRGRGRGQKPLRPLFVGLNSISAHRQKQLNCIVLLCGSSSNVVAVVVVPFAV